LISTEDRACWDEPTDLWQSPSENLQRIRDAGAQDGVFPVHADARSLSFA
jgi:hypothetical protein